MGSDTEGPFKREANEGEKEEREGRREGGRKKKICLSRLRENIGDEIFPDDLKNKSPQ